MRVTECDVAAGAYVAANPARLDMAEQARVRAEANYARGDSIAFSRQAGRPAAQEPVIEWGVSIVGTNHVALHRSEGSARENLDHFAGVEPDCVRVLVSRIAASEWAEAGE